MSDTVPVIEDTGEPIYLPDRDRYYADSDAAALDVWDDGGDPTAVIAHPCTVGKASTPDIAEYITEVWGEQYDDPDAYDVGHLSKRASALCEELQRVLEEQAPTLWTPRTKERVALPVVAGVDL